MLLKISILFTMFYISWSINIDQIADACIRFIQPPSSNSDIAALLRTLDVNCLYYYNLHVDQLVITNLTDLYKRGTESAQQYQNMYTANEHEQYNAKSWLSIVASDPLSNVQRQAKECNAHLLKSFIGNEDIVRTGDVFLKSLKYMNRCFNDTYTFAKQQQYQLLADFNYRILSVTNASQTMKIKYMQMTHDHTSLMDFRQIYKDNIISNYEKIFIDPIKN